MKQRSSYRALLAVVNTLPMPIAEEIELHLATLLPMEPAKRKNEIEARDVKRQRT